MDGSVREELLRSLRDESAAAVLNLAAAESAVVRGQFNLAKVLRAVAHAQRVQAMAAARLLVPAAPPIDPIVEAGAVGRDHVLAVPVGEPVSSDRLAVYRERAALVQAQVGDLIQRSRASLATASDVPESVVDLQLWGCYGCGSLMEGDRPDCCPRCGALAVEFERFGPFYSTTAEHLGRLDPSEIVAILAAIPDEVAEVLGSASDAVLGHKPSATEWSAKEILGHVLETDLLFARRVRMLLTSSGVASLDSPTPPWKLQEGKGYDDLAAAEILSRLRAVRTTSLELVRSLTPADWARWGTNGGRSTSLLDLGTWLANHDRGHLAQVRRQCSREI